MKTEVLIHETLCRNLTDKAFLKEIGVSRKEMEQNLQKQRWKHMAADLAAIGIANKRCNAQDVLAAVKKIIPQLSEEPEEGWLRHCYSYLLAQLFPEMGEPDGAAFYHDGRSWLLQILRSVYSFEREHLPFDPTKDMQFLTDSEVEEKGYTQEYIHMHKLVKSKYVYEFMRIGIDITPFNTLGHISGVHYVAMFAARQLAKAGVPVDLALVSGAAAGHDIGKYGCRKSEEKRIPYLHYYYTDLCYNRFQMPTIGHIAANHSTWDLELENLSVESLLLIYADFRVKSSRNEKGEEVVHFYSLAEAYDVILGKLDNVDDAKKLRYQKVYDKLKDFENYMEENGVHTELPEDFATEPKEAPHPKVREIVLLEGEEIVNQLKFSAIGHNIRLMSRFHQDSEFASLIEAARSEQQWKNLRTYISILGEYSTYMTEKQKLLTLKFLYELLSHKESDIRSRAAEIMGCMVAGFSEEYKKEVPTDITLPDLLVSNLTLWEQYLTKILNPSYKLTDQHKKWISNTLDSFVRATVNHCKPSCRHKYFDILEKFYQDTENHTESTAMVLLDAAAVIDRSLCTESFVAVMSSFLKGSFGRFSRSVDIGVLSAARCYFDAYTEERYDTDLRMLMKLPKDEDFDKQLAAMFLDDLKTGTPWIQKVANIGFMLKHAIGSGDRGKLLHVATHLSNLVKVSETVTVRRAAGEGLLHMIAKMPPDQRNELTVELFNGLELGDYQFSKYIPDYLGVIMLYLPPKELDESIDELQKILETGNEMTASSVVNTLGVMLEHYSVYKENFYEKGNASEKRRFRLLNLLVKAYASYNHVCSEEAFWILGTRVFGSEVLSLAEKNELFCQCYKKLAVLLSEKTEDPLDFYNNAAVLNHIYRYIGQNQIETGNFDFQQSRKVAFFPGTFDPFSLGHKAVATTIRDMGFTVYMALDEFSWSKNTQPRLQRRKIMNMSVADEADIYVFPEDIPVNIANPQDIKVLKDTFCGKELYIAVGTDVIKNASCYKAPPETDSIHTLNHIAFARESGEQKEGAEEEKGYPITGEVVYLRLKKYYEDISSTRIRENIDLNRDISNLIDTVAQNYIYDRNLYLREPAYKHVLQAKEITISSYEHRDVDSLDRIREDLISRGYDMERIKTYLSRQGVRTLYIENGVRQKKMAAFAAAHRVETSQLLAEFGDPAIASHIRDKATGGIAVIGALFVGKGRAISNVNQILITEILTELLARDFAYVVYHPADEAGYNPRVIEALRRQGFINIAEAGSQTPIYAVDMRSPIVVFRDVETVIKNPLNKNPKVLHALDEAHNKMLRVLTGIYHGQLVLSFNTSAVHNKIIGKVAKLNGVPVEPAKNRQRGPYMSVPFGKALADVVVPNTVTKALHTEKYFDSDLSHFNIAEMKHYAALDNQAKTIKSFNRPIILIDDLLHKGYRMNILDPILKQNQVEVKEIIVGVMTGNGRDLMAVRNRKAESAYFLPSLQVWINERDSYPFIGGDSMAKDADSSINLILPYTMPTFIKAGTEAVFDYSMTCLENARDILKVLEQEYQATFERKLTLKRLGEVITYPRRPDIGNGISYDENLAPSAYVENDIEKLIRMRLKG
ncbi:MAG: phosphohydrolase [Emergencia sp.]|jgi:nicotinic acid mononucleotide adenylyltransferase|nr:phosphohydrolase [Emergencia sp.]